MNQVNDNFGYTYLRNFNDSDKNVCVYGMALDIVGDIAELLLFN